MKACINRVWVSTSIEYKAGSDSGPTRLSLQLGGLAVVEQDFKLLLP